MAVPQPPKQKIKPGIAGIIIGIVLMFLGVGSCVGGFAWVAYNVNDAVADSPPIQAGSDQTFEISKGTNAIVAAIAQSPSDAKQVSVGIVGPDGQSQTLEAVGSGVGSTQDSDGRAVEYLGQFKASEAGDFVVTVSGPIGSEEASKSFWYTARPSTINKR